MLPLSYGTSHARARSKYFYASRRYAGSMASGY
jgi:hypothetical protein